MLRVIFQGDSVTDSGRARDNEFNKGFGYAGMASGILGAEHPLDFEFYNRGVGGDRMHNILARNQRDVLELKPDVVSILGGINDVWYYLDKPGGFDKTYYTMIYEIVLNEIKKALPEAKIITFGTFVLPGDNTGSEESDKWKAFSEGSARCNECNKAVSERFGVTYTPLQNIFDDGIQRRNEYSYWLKDGIHPTVAGHWLIANEWMTVFKSLR